jgi:hypothetical protein
LNATQYQTQGWDLKIDYRKPTAFGTFGVHAAGTKIVHDLRQYSIDSPFLEYAGYPADGGEAKIKANTTLTWEFRRWTLGWSSTYTSSYYQYWTPGSPLAIQFGPNPIYGEAQGGLTIPSQVYHSFFGTYNIPEKSVGLFSNMTVNIIVNNAFNTSPPFDAFFAPYFYSPYGDPRQRNYQISLRKGF